jgi:hypothetical protein
MIGFLIKIHLFYKLRLLGLACFAQYLSNTFFSIDVLKISMQKLMRKNK